MSTRTCRSARPTRVSVSTRTPRRRRLPTSSSGWSCCRTGCGPSTSGRCSSCCRASTRRARTARSSASSPASTRRDAASCRSRRPSAPSSTTTTCGASTRHARARGEIGIFNRSHYEDIVTVRVLGIIDDAERDRRYRPRQRVRAAAAPTRARPSSRCSCTSARTSSANACRRVSTTRRSAGSSTPTTSTTAQAWDEYQERYDATITETSTKWAPWYVVPADHKWISGLEVAELLLRDARTTWTRSPAAHRRPRRHHRRVAYLPGMPTPERNACRRRATMSSRRQRATTRTRSSRCSAPDAVWYDPVGQPPHVGHDGIAAFWDQTRTMADKIELMPQGRHRVRHRSGDDVRDPRHDRRRDDDHGRVETFEVDDDGQHREHEGVLGHVDGAPALSVRTATEIVRISPQVSDQRTARLSQGCRFGHN